MTERERCHVLGSILRFARHWGTVSRGGQRRGSASLLLLMRLSFVDEKTAGTNCAFMFMQGSGFGATIQQAASDWATFPSAAAVLKLDQTRDTRCPPHPRHSNAPGRTIQHNKQNAMTSIASTSAAAQVRPLVIPYPSCAPFV